LANDFPLADVAAFFFSSFEHGVFPLAEVAACTPHTLRPVTMLNEITVLGADFAVVGAEPLGLPLPLEALRTSTRTS
jgi:hypothetical protein